MYHKYEKLRKFLNPIYKYRSHKIQHYLCLKLQNVAEKETCVCHKIRNQHLNGFDHLKFF